MASHGLRHPGGGPHAGQSVWWSGTRPKNAAATGLV